MKKINFWLLLSLFVAAFAMSACSSSDDATGGGGGGGDDPTPPVVPTKAAVSGAVYSYGAPVSGVKVTVGTASVTTGFNGMFYFEQASGSTIKFEKEGFATIVRAISGDNAKIEVNMSEVQTQTFSASTAKSLNVSWNGMKVDLPAGYVDANGNAYTGTNVTAKSAYLDPDLNEFANYMPGDLTAIRSDQSEAALISYGMISVELTGDNGEKLQPGSPATLTFPVPTNAKLIGGQLPATMPLWSFNEETGLWEEEGVATLNGDGTAYVGTVNHFSWHNLDYPEARASLDVKVVDVDGNAIAGIPVNFDGQRTAYTNADGVASCVVPRNTDLVISINSDAYGDYAMDASGTYDESKLIKQNVNLGNNASGSITLTMPSKAPVISGTVTNEGTGSSVCTLWITYGDYGETTRVISNLTGAYTLYAPAAYRGAAKLIAQFGDGYKVEQDIIITDENQTIDLVANNSSAASAGVIVVTGDGLNTRYLAASPTGGAWEEAVTYDATRGLQFSCDLGGENKNQGWGGVYITIPDYDETQANFTTNNGKFEYFMEGTGGWTRLSTGAHQGSTEIPITINVKKEGDTYTFIIANANAYLIDRSLGIEFENEMQVKMSVEISGKKVTQSAQ